MIRRPTRSDARSVVRKWAHILERIGLAAAGGSCGLFVAAHIARANIDLLGSAIVVLMMMLYGALGFYFGIDLPPPPAHRMLQPLLRGRGSRTDAVELLSAAGTFLASTTAFASVYVIILDETVHVGFTLFIGFCWAVGATMQIAAGVIARARGSDASEL
jgi:hypothetical protein